MKTLYVKQLKRFVGRDYIGEDGVTVEMGGDKKDGCVNYYKITKLVNSPVYNIGDELSRDHISDLCDQTEVWKVIIS